MHAPPPACTTRYIWPALAVCAVARFSTLALGGSSGQGPLAMLAAVALLSGLVPGQAGARTVFRIVLGALLCCMALYDLERVFRVVLPGLTFPFTIDPMEGREAVKAWLVSQGINIYSPLTGYPYLVTLYGPVYYLLLAALPVAPHSDPLLVGRVVSLTCYALAGLACLGAIRRTPLSVTLVVLLLAGFPIFGWEYAVKPDMLAWLAALVALAAMDRQTRKPDGPNWGHASLVGALFALAMGTKLQTAVAAVAALTWLALSGRWRHAFRLGASTTLFGAVIILAAQWATSGQFVRQTLLFPAYFSGLAEHNSYAVAWDRFAPFLTSNWPLFAASFLGIALRLADRSAGLWEICLVLFSLSAFVALKWYGSASNNLIGLFFVLFILVGELAGRLYLSAPWGRAGVAALAALVVSLPSDLPPRLDRPAPDREPLMALRALLLLTDQPILISTEAAWPYIGLTTPQKLKLFDAFELAFYGNFSGFDFLQCSVAEDIRNRRPGFIVDDRHVAPPAFRRLARTFYRLHSVWRDVPVLAPRTGDVMTLTALGIAENYGESRVRLVRSVNLRQIDDRLEPERPNGAAWVHYELNLRPGADAVSLRLYPGILDMDARIQAQISQNGEHWRPWFASSTVIGFNEAFWGDWPQEERLTGVEGPRLHVRLVFLGNSRLWLSPEAPMAFYAP